MNVHDELQKQSREIAKLKEIVRSFRGGPIIHGYSGKVFELNESLNVRELLARITDVEAGSGESDGENLITLIDSTSTTNVIYIGQAEQGEAPTATTGWRVVRIDKTSSPTEILKSENYANFGDAWADRETMSYD